MDMHDPHIAGSRLQIADFAENPRDKSPMLPSFVELLENGDGSEVEEVAEPLPASHVKKERGSPLRKKAKEAAVIAAAFKDMVTSMVDIKKRRAGSGCEKDDGSDNSFEEESTIERGKRELELQKMQYEREDRKELVAVLRQIARAFDRIADKL